MRERLEGDPAFTAVTVEAERIRIFNEHIATLEVCIQSSSVLLILDPLNV